jgi:hypothetical protein
MIVRPHFSLLCKSAFFLSLFFMADPSGIASCNQLEAKVLEPFNERSPRNLLLAHELQEVRVAWSVCSASDKYFLRLERENGREFSHELLPSQKRAFVSNLLLLPGESYTLALEQIASSGKTIDRVERKFSTTPPTAAQLALRNSVSRGLASVSAGDSAGSRKGWFDPYAGTGFASYTSSTPGNIVNFSLPAILAGFHASVPDGIGAAFEFLQTLGSAQVSSSVTVTSYYSFVSLLSYRFSLDENWAVEPLAAFSAQAVSETSSGSRIIADGLTHWGAGARGEWFRGSWRARGGVILSPHLGASAGLGKIAADVAAVYFLQPRMSLALPVSYQYFSQSSSGFGGMISSALSAGLVFGYSL